MSNGDRYERRLVNSLRTCGHGAMRCPSSGAATEDDLPDVLAGRLCGTTGRPWGDANLSEAWAIEVKSTSDTTAYVTEPEVDALCRFAREFGAQPFLAARFKSNGSPRQHLVPPYAARMTDTGNYGLPISDIEERAEVVVYEGTDAQDARVEEVRL